MRRRDISFYGESRTQVVGHTEVAVSERCVAEPITKWVKRLAFEVPIGPVRHLVVFEVGQLADILVERNRQPARWIVLAAQRYSDRRAALFAWAPRLENRVGVLVDPVHPKGTAVRQDHNEGFAGRRDSFNQCFFRFREIAPASISRSEEHTSELQSAQYLVCRLLL